jgi:hypothetical protein
MITNEQILQIAREHLEEFPDDFNATREQLIAFAQEIYEMGNENGWESRAESEYLCSSAPFVGDDE